ncbi:hypothetical protein CP02DC21_0190 [Chlamydia psittaci 02DC21]|nr:hypothetical protein CP02DC21_0190 [Chlamydia psittaci 02DC21]
MRKKSLFAVVTDSRMTCLFCMMTSSDIFSCIAMSIAWYCHISHLL